MVVKLIVVCRFGGDFRETEGESIYVGGEAYAFEVDETTQIDSFMSEVVRKCALNSEESTLSLKYYVPGDKSILISLKDDVDIRNFVRMHKESISAEIYVMKQSGYTTHNRVTTSQSNETNSTDYVENAPKLLSLWRDAITGIGQLFEGADEFRKALRKYAITYHFAYTFIKNEKSRVAAKCKEEGCNWRIHASRVEKTNVFRVQTFEKNHCCDPGIGKKTHPQASKKLVASLVQDKLKDTPAYRAREIINDIRRDYGVSLSYQQAYRGKELSCNIIHGSREDSFNQIPWLCSKIIETNPGSHAVWETTNDNSFQRLFVSFHAQIIGFKNACRPLLFIDGTFGKDHYKVTLLSAVAIDANNQMFPIAFSVVLGETQENWLWLLCNLKIILEGVDSLTFISDRHPGLVNSVLQVFPDSYHSFCVHHLVANLMGTLSGKIRQGGRDIIKNLVYAAGRSVSVEWFNENLKKIKNISVEAYEWLKDSDPCRWAEVYARGTQYGHLTTNVVESFNGWILKACGLPIIALVNTIREQLMELFYKLREESMQWTKSLTPYVDGMVNKNVLDSLTCRVSPSNNFLYEVNDGKVCSVNLETMVCTCIKWRTTKIPCIHVAKVCEETGRSIIPYCSPYYKTELWRLAYTKAINPIPNDIMAFEVIANEEVPQVDHAHESLQPNHVLPPHVRPRPGRPKRKRIESQPKVKRPLHCGRCHEEGHNRLSCRRAI